MPNPHIKHLVGGVFGLWTLVERRGIQGTAPMALFRCRCGTERVDQISNKASGRSKSCGCVGRGGTYADPSGNKLSLREWAKKLGLNTPALLYRIKKYGPVVLSTTWEPPKQTHTKKWVTIGGVTRPMTEWLKLAGITRQAYHQRIRWLWSEADALTIPKGVPRKHVLPEKYRRKA